MKFPTIKPPSFLLPQTPVLAENERPPAPGYSLRSVFDDNEAGKRYLDGYSLPTAQVSERESATLHLDISGFMNNLLSPQNQSGFNLRIANQQADTVLQRLDRDQQLSLKMNQDLLLDSDFIALAAELSDEELNQFVSVATSLHTSPSERHQQTSISGKSSSIKKFTETLSELDGEDRSQVLAQASYFSKKVPPANNDTYDIQGKNSGTNNSAANNQLHNFIMAVNNSEEPRKLLNDLAGYDEEQQAQLLNVLSVSTSLGNELISQLGDFEKKEQEIILDYLGDIAGKIQPTGQKSLDMAAFDPYMALEEVSRLDSNRLAMLEDTIGLLKHYQFSKEQLAETFGELKNMGEADQQAYLKITSTGLEQILGLPESDAGESAEKIDLYEHPQALETITLLRSDSSIRELVTKSALGNKVRNEENQQVYTLKDQISAEKDQNTMIKLLTTDAWIRTQNDKDTDSSEQSHRLAGALLELKAEHRDELVEKIASYAENEAPLKRLSRQELNQSYSNSYARTSTLANNGEILNLLDSELAWMENEDVNNAFWQINALAEEQGDMLFGVIDATPELIRNQLTRHFANRADGVFNGEFGRNLAKNEIDEFIDFMLNEPDKDKKQEYINDMTGQDIPLYWQQMSTAGSDERTDIENQAWETYNNGQAENPP
ncbi:hypothetical protein [Thalassomonas actiniarum]|uniref:Uncharacterized protein n=1 Tax=Thalassomonas actiniarum TaxID=485447 RepID=A0AAE9YUB1_9GAMM|nr:hypothetical protein [Thalassomonas actiniarum]WDD99647.1 hypothetical protein SG35_002945 [Thalassomonas actiniarum]